MLFDADEAGADAAALSGAALADGDPERVRLARRVLFDADEAVADAAAFSGAAGAVADAAASRVRPGAAAFSGANGPTPRLTPPRDDRAAYRLLLQGQNVRANGKLTAAWRRIDHGVSRLALPESRRFFDFLTQRVELARLSIPAAVDPNAVFETINCRGKPLDDLDLLRNHLYSWFNDEAEAPRRDSVHERLERTRAHLRADAKFAEYARCYFQLRFGFLRKNAFYRETRRRIQSDARADGRTPPAYVHDLVADLARPERIALFRIVSAPTRGDAFLEAFSACAGPAANGRDVSTLLHELKGYTVTHPLVFALLSHFAAQTDAERRARAAAWVRLRLANLTSFVMRTAFVAPKFEPSHVERGLCDAARRIAAAARPETVEVDAALRQCDTHGVLDDVSFTTRMQTVEMRDARKAKRLLLGLAASRPADGPPPAETRCAVDHILPKTARHWPGWPGFRGVAPELWVHRLGNLALLDTRDGKPADADSASFAAKQQRYAASSLRLTRDVARYDDWTPAAIGRRQRRLAALATEVWSFREEV